MSAVRVAAGEVYRAPARRGFRYVRIDQVRRPAEGTAHAIAHEVTSDGERTRGWLRGVPRDLAMTIMLVPSEGAYAMPARYERVAMRSDP